MSTNRSAESAFGSASPHVLALDHVLTQLESVEQRLRSVEAERIALLVEAFDIAALEGVNAEGGVPSGPSGELAYRAVRAELAACLQLSERAVERQLTQATDLHRHYGRVREAFAEGGLSLRHTSVIVDAGRVIGTGGDVDVVMRRSAYESAVLEVALVETPARLAPIARRLAEQCAQVTLDERHVEARERRSVTVRDLDDGMADLIAHLPAAEAHCVFDRLSRMSRRVEESERQGELMSSTPSSGSTYGIERYRRTRDAIRADLLTSLVLASGTGGEEVPTLMDGERGEHYGLSEHSGIGRQSEHSELGKHRGFGGRNELSRPSGPSGLSAVRAQVQVVVPVAVLSAAGAGAAVAETDSAAGGSAGHSAGDPVTGFAGSATASDGQAAARANHDATCAESDEEAWFEPVPVATLTGSGPIDLDTARELAAHATHWDMVRVNAESGVVLSVDRYRPSEHMRRVLSARDQHCRFPGCGVLLTRCDIDHTIDAALGGPTSTDNLAHLCRAHHTLKHHSGWQVRQVGDGVLDWTSPTGRHRTDRPPGRVTFVEVDPVATDDFVLRRRCEARSSPTGRAKGKHADDNAQPF